MNQWIEQAEKAICLYNFEPLESRMRGERGSTLITYGLPE